MRRCQRELADTLKNKIPIYLDIKFWIGLRKATSGLPCDPLAGELLHSLRQLVASGKIFCPISDSTFAELLKQNDTRTREATAQLIDELSLGVTFVSFEERIRAEIDLFLRSVLNDGSVGKDGPLLWSRPSYVLGHVHPSRAGFAKYTELAIQKAFFDHMWTWSFTEMIRRLGNAPFPNLAAFDAIASRLNSENAKHSDDFRSFEQCISLEAAGAVDVFATDVLDAIGEIWTEKTGRRAEMGQEERNRSERECRSVLFAVLRRSPTKQHLRTLHIYVYLHAYIRWDKVQRLNSNDLFDFRHAAAGLGYCSAFFTDKAVQAVVTARHVALDKMMDCRVIADFAEAVEFLENL